MSQREENQALAEAARLNGRENQVWSRRLANLETERLRRRLYTPVSRRGDA